MQGYLRFVYDQMSNPTVIIFFIVLETVLIGLALWMGGWWLLSLVPEVPFLALDVLKLVQISRARRQDFY